MTAPVPLSDRVFAVLSAFGDEPLGVTEVARTTGLDKSVVHRIIRSAVTRGFLIQDAQTRMYRVGLRAWELGQHYRGAARLSQAATPILRRLSAELEVTSYLGVLEGSEMLYIALIDSPGPIRIAQSVGNRVPADRTAMGRAVLARLNDEEVDRQLDALDPTRRAAALPEIERARSTGLARNRGELTYGVASVGAALNSVGSTAAISAAFLLLEGNERLWDLLSERLPEAVREIDAAVRQTE